MVRLVGQGDANVPNRGYELYITAIVMVILAGLTVLTRVAARWAGKRFGLDDYTIVASLVRHTSTPQIPRRFDPNTSYGSRCSRSF